MTMAKKAEKTQTTMALEQSKAAPPAQSRPKTLRGMIASDVMRDQFAMALPSILTPDRFIRVAITALNRTPKLQDCTQESVFGCLMDCAALGIEPDGRRAHLIPYGNKATLIIDYKGLIELARRSGEVSLWRAELVCENDVFVYSKGEVTKHEIDFRKPRGPVFAVYSYVRFKDGTEDYEPMELSEIEAIKERSPAWQNFKRYGTTCPWNTDENEMRKKTCIRRHSKRLPLSAEFRDALDKDGDKFDDVVDATPRDDRPKVDRLAERLAAAPEPEPEQAPEGIATATAEVSEPAMPDKDVTEYCPNCGGKERMVQFTDGSVQCQKCTETYEKAVAYPGDSRDE
jgi:recombination protein RecT